MPAKLKAGLIGLGLGLVCVIAGYQMAFAADKGGDSIFADAPVAPPREGLFVYFGLHGGLTMASMEQSASGLPISNDGGGHKGAIGGVHGGIDYVFSSRMFAGLWGSYSWQNTEWVQTLGPVTQTSALGDSYAVGGRLGYDWGKVKVYGLAGWRHTDLEFTTSVGGVSVPMPAGLPTSMNGIDLGLGAGVMINKNLELDVKGVWTKYQDEHAGSGMGHPVYSTDQLQILTSLNFKF